jgi:hypothetical protein
MWPQCGPELIRSRPGRGRLRRSGPPRPGTGSAGRVRQGRCKPRYNRPLLAKPDRAGPSPATAENGAGRGRCDVVHDCPLGTGQDRCEWHGSGTAGEDDACPAWQCRYQLDRRVSTTPATPASLARAAGPRQRSGGRTRAQAASLEEVGTADAVWPTLLVCRA